VHILAVAVAHSCNNTEQKIICRQAMTQCTLLLHTCIHSAVYAVRSVVCLEMHRTAPLGITQRLQLQRSKQSRRSLMDNLGKLKHTVNTIEKSNMQLEDM
jgi:hypothetical protein